MHVGKTGGTSITKAIADAHAAGAHVPLVLNHKWTMPMARVRYPTAKLAVVLRDPLERIVSGFNDRLRQSSDEGPIVWTSDEAAAFGFFASSDEFLKAILTGNSRSRSAVRFAMGAVRHLRRGYVHHFVSPDYVRANAHRFYCIGDIARLPAFFDRLLRPLNPGGGNYAAYLARHNSAQDGGSGLQGFEARDLQVLRAFFAAEYAIHDGLRALSEAEGREQVDSGLCATPSGA